MYITEHGGEWREGECQKESTLVRAKPRTLLLSCSCKMAWISSPCKEFLQEKHVVPPPLYIKGDVSGVIAHCPLKMGATQRSEG